ncbi:MAG TPA: hypothetical protein VGP31_00290 [Planosporangium sp.]|nr:hypothetical protein [Planosporangium sp.]
MILLLGWLAARLLRTGVDRLLRRVGFDRAVERGGVGRLLARTPYDARGVMTSLVYYTVLLFTLQLAFGVWGPNPVSDLIAAVVAWLPNAFIAIAIVVVAAAIAAGVRNLIVGLLGGLSYGRLLAGVASAFIVGIGIIAALNQIGVATSVTTPVLIAVLASIAGILVVGVGGGLVRPMQSRWESWLSRAEQEMPQVREQLRVAAEQRQAEREEAARREAEAREAAEAAAREAAEAARAAEIEREQEAERARLRAAQEEAARLEAERAESARLQAQRAEAARQDEARAEAARQEVARRDALQTEAAREEAARLEAERAEATRLEAERAEATRLEAQRAEATREEVAQAEAAKKPRTARDRAEQAAARRAAAEAGTLPEVPPSDEPTVALSASRLREMAPDAAGVVGDSGQDAEQTQPIQLPVTQGDAAADDSESTQVLPTALPTAEPEQPAPPKPPARRRGTTRK